MKSFSCWGWSDSSLEEAQKEADKRTRAIAGLIQAGKRPDSYLYGDRPLREQIIEEWKSEESKTYAAVTLNSYGCHVLNTTRIMFVDVDLPDIPAWESLKHRLSSLFGNHAKSPQTKQEDDALDKVRRLAQTVPECGVRVYRTCGGLRYLMINTHANPASEATHVTMEALGVDPLYLRLCKVQECFRARLTPKSWRCGMDTMRVRYPRHDQKDEDKVRDWIDAYTKKAEQYATCKFLFQLGPDGVENEVKRVVEFHDTMTKAHMDLRLA